MIESQQETVVRKTPVGLVPCPKLSNWRWSCTIKPVAIKDDQVLKWQVVMTKPITRRKMFKVQTKLAALEFATLFCEQAMRPEDKPESNGMQMEIPACEHKDCCGGIGSHAADCNYATGN